MHEFNSAQFKSKLDKLIRVVCEWCELLGYA
jgi:hypothetical protein